MKIHNAFHVSFLKPYQEAENQINFIQTDVKLDPAIFQRVCKELNFKPTLDVFANAKHHQLSRYCSLDASDTQAFATDGFSLSWTTEQAFINPPFYYMGKVLRKLCSDQATALVVVPELPQAKWWTLFSQLVVKELVLSEPMFLTAKAKLRPTPPWKVHFAVVTGKRLAPLKEGEKL
jgi:hypothetical protein